MGKPTNLIHITPELPPAIGGVADYTEILSHRLVEVSEGNIKPVLIRAGWKQDEEPQTTFPVYDLHKQCSADRLAHTIQNLADRANRKPVILLEYSGYGYASKGAPLWLLNGLKKVCGENGIPLLTMFHELYATGPPWTSAFWISPLQRHVASGLAKLSSGVITNREQSAQWLQKYIRNGTQLWVQPVFSNVGEPEEIIPFEERDPIAVVFGGQNMKQRLYNKWNKRMDWFLEKMGIERIIDIGPCPNSRISIKKIPVRKVGIQSSEKVGDYLKKAKFGLLHYPSDFITKSGVWASYLAFGVPILNVTEKPETHFIGNDKYCLGLKHFNQNHNSIHINEIVDSSYDWYRNKINSKEAAKNFINLFSQ